MKVASKKPGKQRKAFYNSKNHQRTSLMSTRIADFLAEDYGVKRMPLRVGDSVRVTKGEFQEFEGEVLEINRKTRRVKIKEVTFEKTDGTTFYPMIDSSNLIITKFYKEKKMDAWRAKMIERKSYKLVDEKLIAPKKNTKKGDEQND